MKTERSNDKAQTNWGAWIQIGVAVLLLTGLVVSFCQYYGWINYWGMGF